MTYTYVGNVHKDRKALNPPDSKKKFRVYGLLVSSMRKEFVLQKVYTSLKIKFA